MKLTPELLVFEMYGVLVDVRESYRRTILETLRHFTGRRVWRGKVERWKNRSGYNEDPKLNPDWIQALGGGRPIERSNSILSTSTGQERSEQRCSRALVAWARACSGAAQGVIPTVRKRREPVHTLARHARLPAGYELERRQAAQTRLRGVAAHGDGGAPGRDLYLGNPVDNALRAQPSGMTFVRVLSRNSHTRRLRAERLRSVGAKIISGKVTELEKYLA